MYGSSGLELSILGFGAGLIGDASMDEQYAGYFLNHIVDSGITFIDTARGYGLSEERIGRHLSWRRGDFVLSTKVGYGVPGYSDWTYDCIIAGVHQALRTLRTDYIDIVHLHSCSMGILQQGDVITALNEMVKQGHIRCAAYSGENNELDFAMKTNRFSGFMSSVNMFDQTSIDRNVAEADRNHLGYIAKRPLGNTPWRHQHRPIGQYCEEYWARMKSMNMDFGDEWQDIALRFSVFTPGITSSITGSTNAEHVKQNITIVQKGPLSEQVYNQIRNTYKHHESHWTGQL